MVKEMSNMFLINAPAGSGKTTYIENTIMNLLWKQPNRRILGITYTNRAKEELRSRVDSKNVTIDTIHSFLSRFISLYLSKTETVNLYLRIFNDKIESLISAGENEPKNQRYIEKYGKLNLETIKNNLQKIYYNEQSFSSYFYGGLSHDDLIYFCRKMFDEFLVLRKRLSSKYSYIFIDEYQDTSADVLYIFYESLLNTNCELYLLGDKMQEIYQNYDGSFNDLICTFNKKENLNTNYRCSSKIVNVLNGLYNDKCFFQSTAKQYPRSRPVIFITDLSSGNLLDQFEGYMQLYLFNRTRFEKIGVYDLFNAFSQMKEYKFPSKYTPTDVLTNKTVDNPDKLFRALFCICEFVNLIDKKAYGRCIRLARGNNHIFNRNMTAIGYHNDKVAFSKKINSLKIEFGSQNKTLLEFCCFLTENEYCPPTLFLPFITNEEYQQVLNVPLKQLVLLHSYLNAPKISTQHGVKGEGHDNVCFISEDSKQNPIVYMYDFFRLLCTQDINLTDFQGFYYEYRSIIKAIDRSNLSPASLYNQNKIKYIDHAKNINDRYKNNKYFIFCQQEKYTEFLKNPTASNAKECFKETKTRGILWAYKLFYVGCSRAKNKLVVLVDVSKVASFKEAFIKKMISIGFDINELS